MSRGGGGWPQGRAFRSRAVGGGQGGLCVQWHCAPCRPTPFFLLFSPGLSLSVARSRLGSARGGGGVGRGASFLPANFHCPRPRPARGINLLPLYFSVAGRRGAARGTAHVSSPPPPTPDARRSAGRKAGRSAPQGHNRVDRWGRGKGHGAGWAAGAAKECSFKWSAVPHPAGLARNPTRFCSSWSRGHASTATATVGRRGGGVPPYTLSSWNIQRVALGDRPWQLRT